MANEIQSTFDTYYFVSKFELIIYIKSITCEQGIV